MDQNIARDVARVNMQICAWSTRLQEWRFARTKAPWQLHVCTGMNARCGRWIAIDNRRRSQCVNGASISGAWQRDRGILCCCRESASQSKYSNAKESRTLWVPES